MNQPKFESTFVMEIVNFASCEEYGICWNFGTNNPDVINLNTGLKKNGKSSLVSKVTFRYMFHCICEKLKKESAEGTDKYNQVKRMFYDALKTKNFGVWDDQFK